MITEINYTDVDEVLGIWEQFGFHMLFIHLKCTCMVHNEYDLSRGLSYTSSYKMRHHWTSKYIDISVYTLRIDIRFDQTIFDHVYLFNYLSIYLFICYL